MKKQLLIIVAVLIVFGVTPLYSQQWVRPIHLTGQDTKVVKQDSVYFFLMDSMWVETRGEKVADLKFDTLFLDNDKAQGNEKYTNHKEKALIETHEGLAVTLTWNRTIYKYDTLSIEVPQTLKDKVLNVSDSMVLFVQGKDEKFRLIVNDTILLDSIYFAGKPINIDTLLLCGSIPEFDKNKTQSVDIKKIMVWPHGHVPSFVRELDYSVCEDRSTLYEEEKYVKNPTFGKWEWGMLIASLLFLILVFVHCIRRDLSEKEGESEEKQESGTDQNVVQGLEFEEQKEQLSEKENEIKETEKQNDDELISKEFGDLRRKYEEEKKVTDERINQLNKTIDDLRKKNKDALEEKDKEFNEEKDGLNRRIEALKKEQEEALDKKKKEYEKEKDRLNERIEGLKSEKEKAIAKKEEEFSKEKKKLEEKLEEKDKRIKSIESEVRREMQKKIDEIGEELGSKVSELGSVKKNLETTTAFLKTTESELAKEKNEVATLQEAQRKYSEKVVITPWASRYATKILSLTDLCKRISEASKKLMEVDVEDKYFIMKAVAQYDMNISGIDMQRFYTDIYMAANKQMAFSDGGVANLSTVDAKQQPRALMQYFLSAYLEKYISALVVLNESLAGVHRLIPDMPAAETAQFAKFRTELEHCFNDLEIKVISVKLFDKITNNVDVKAEEVDFDDNIPADSILEIKNCIVYAADGVRPNEKIFVKSQK